MSNKISDQDLALLNIVVELMNRALDARRKLEPLIEEIGRNLESLDGVVCVCDSMISLVLEAPL